MRLLLDHWPLAFWPAEDSPVHLYRHQYKAFWHSAFGVGYPHIQWHLYDAPVASSAESVHIQAKIRGLQQAVVSVGSSLIFVRRPLSSALLNYFASHCVHILSVATKCAVFIKHFFFN